MTPACIMGCIVYKLNGNVQHADEFRRSFGLFSVIIFHGNILQYILRYGCHVLQYITIRFWRIMTPINKGN
jgi:hypothetical protein